MLVVTVDVHDPWKQLRYKFLSARTMDEDYRQLIAEKKGVRASSFDILAGLNPITASPPGLMHAAFLRKCLYLVVIFFPGLILAVCRNDECGPS